MDSNKSCSHHECCIHVGLAHRNILVHAKSQGQDDGSVVVVGASSTAAVRMRGLIPDYTHHLFPITTLGRGRVSFDMDLHSLCPSLRSMVFSRNKKTRTRI